MQDKTLTCRDCGREFTFTQGEQEFFAQKGFTNEPSRCPECRATNKASRGGGGGGYSSGGGYSGGGYERREREMFPAVCAQCGKDTQVPFQPSGDRPVYCSDCFSAQRSSSTVAGTGRTRRAAAAAARNLTDFSRRDAQSWGWPFRHPLFVSQARPSYHKRAPTLSAPIVPRTQRPVVKRTPSDGVRSGSRRAQQRSQRERCNRLARRLDEEEAARVGAPKHHPPPIPGRKCRDVVERAGVR